MNKQFSEDDLESMTDLITDYISKREMFRRLNRQQL